MFDFKGNITLDGTFVEKCKNIIKDITNLPKWLIGTLLIAIFLGGIYFYHNYISNKDSISLLYQQVEAINKTIGGQVTIDNYKESLIYVITEIKLINLIEESDHNNEILEIDLMILYFKDKEPNNPIIVDLEAMKLRIEVEYNVYSHHYEYIINQLNNIVKDSKNDDEESK